LVGCTLQTGLSRGQLSGAKKRNMIEPFDFIFVPRPYAGKFTLKNLAFNANLQEFAQAVSYVSNLESDGKISPLKAYTEIEELFEHLARTSKQLGIIENP
jgi:hypothetical protein